MITWKIYYHKKILRTSIKKIIPLYTYKLRLQRVIYSDGQIFLEIPNYFKVDLNKYKKSYTKLFISLFISDLALKKKSKLFIIKKLKFFETYFQIIRKYSESFLNVKVVLENIKIKFYQSCFFFLSNYFYRKHDFLIFYILYFNFSSSNTSLHITDSSGKSKIFYSAGLLDLKGKQKVVRRLVLVRLFNLLTLLKLKFIKNFPVAVHFKNVGSNKFLIVKKLKRTFFIKIIKTFELTAYNGCRKKKKRRKR